jgi:integrase
MSRRAGQNPSVRLKSEKGIEEYFLPMLDRCSGTGEAEKGNRSNRTNQNNDEERSGKEEIAIHIESESQFYEYRIPSSLTFAHAVKHYREVFAPGMLRPCTFSVADGHLKVHLEAGWNEIPVEHIDIDAVNEWIWKKRQADLSWVTIKNILRTMQRVLSCSSKDKKPPFSQEGLAIPERDKLQMKIESRGGVSFAWPQVKQTASEVYKLDVDDMLKERYATLSILAAASGLRCAELFALRINDLDFKAGTIRVD